ncbi:MAG: NAD(P)-binding domain-containing protein, partial [Acidimicrobiales bacterium]
MSSSEVIGFIGLGNMGGPMARRLAAAGYDVIGYDIDANALTVAVEAGVKAAADANECARTATILLTSL